MLYNMLIHNHNKQGLDYLMNNKKSGCILILSENNNLLECYNNVK